MLWFSNILHPFKATGMMDKNVKLAEKYDPAEDCALGSIAMDDKMLLRKLDWHILPLMFMTYFLQMIDKISINVCTPIFRHLCDTS